MPRLERSTGVIQHDRITHIWRGTPRALTAVVSCKGAGCSYPKDRPPCSQAADLIKRWGQAAGSGTRVSPWRYQVT
ncbi:hypothetical protein GCM10009077_17210 [Roseibium denhamense]